MPEYRYASEEAYEAFADMKHGIRIHWGPYAVKHLAASWWTRPIYHWKQALNHFAVMCEGRMPELTSK